MPLDESFGIRDEYVHRRENAFFDDTPYRDEWQREVYELALKAATAINATTVVDVGCGSGFKLLKYFSHLRTIGLDLEPTLGFLRETYPDRDWRESSFSADLGPVDVVICSDVVEHLPDPDQLMAFLSRLSFKILVLSTPERKLVYGYDQSGPPANPAHCREWTQAEFHAYASRWFTVVEGGITNQLQATQALVCLPRPRPVAEDPVARPSVLAMVLDFDKWELARKWSYSSSYALVDGLQAAGCDVVVLPSLRMSGSNTNPWVAARDAVLGGRTFDQVWIWVTHSYYDPDVWRWLETVAPVRVGVLMESLTYEPRDVAEIPALAGRKADVYAQLGALTHIITADDTEAAMIETETGRPTRAYLPMLPRDLLAPVAAPRHAVAVFLGTLYGKRLQFLNENVEAGSSLRVLAPPEQETDIPATFDRLTSEALAALSDRGAGPHQAAAYAASVRQLRLDVVRRTLAVYNSCLAGVALPAMFKGVTGRVIEILAASTPALVPRAAGAAHPLPRPLAAEENVLCYDPTVPGDMERQIGRLRVEPGLRDRLVARARMTFERELCSEAQVADLLRWIAGSRR